MHGTRPLTSEEERLVVKAARRSSSRDRLLVSLQLFAGYRLLEALELRVGDVWIDGEPAEFLERPPHPLNRRRKPPLPIPLSSELQIAIRAHCERLERAGQLAADHPLFPGDLTDADGQLLTMNRRTGLRAVRRVMRKAGIFDDGRLGTHVLRKTFARKLFLRSKRNLIMLRDALGHASVSSTDDYIESIRDGVEAAILKADWTEPR